MIRSAGPRAAVFLDRDGTINREVNYLARPEQLELLPGAAAGLRRLREAGLGLVVITNQSGVARGYFSEEDVARVHRRLQAMLGEHGAGVDAFYFCPHHPEGQGAYRQVCPCRKPGTAMLERAAADLDLDLERSFMVGDSVSDMVAGQRLGLRTILVRTGYGQSHLDAGTFADIPVHYVAGTLDDAAGWILAHLEP